MFLIERILKQKIKRIEIAVECFEYKKATKFVDIF